MALLPAGALLIGCAWAISWIFAFLGVVARSASSVQSFSMLVLFPLTFLSNAFVPTQTLPSWLQAFVRVNPITHLVTAERELVETATFSGSAWLALLGATLIVLVMAPLTVHVYKRKA